eukprot:4568415-Pleurochrysis_carterae.AAC.1
MQSENTDAIANQHEMQQVATQLLQLSVGVGSRVPSQQMTAPAPPSEAETHDTKSDANAGNMH